MREETTSWLLGAALCLELLAIHSALASTAYSGPPDFILTL